MILFTDNTLEQIWQTSSYIDFKHKILTEKKVTFIWNKNFSLLGPALISVYETHYTASITHADMFFIPSLIISFTFDVLLYKHVSKFILLCTFSKLIFNSIFYCNKHNENTDFQNVTSFSTSNLLEFYILFFNTCFSVIFMIIVSYKMLKIY